MTTPHDSPALRHRSAAYPMRFEGRVPKTIVLLEEAWPSDCCGVLGLKGHVYPAYVSSHGDVCAIVEGHLLAVKPQQFQTILWHDSKP